MLEVVQLIRLERSQLMSQLRVNSQGTGNPSSTSSGTRLRRPISGQVAAGIGSQGAAGAKVRKARVPRKKAKVGIVIVAVPAITLIMAGILHALLVNAHVGAGESNLNGRPTRL